MCRSFGLGCKHEKNVRINKYACISFSRQKLLKSVRVVIDRFIVGNIENSLNANMKTFFIISLRLSRIQSTTNKYSYKRTERRSYIANEPRKVPYNNIPRRSVNIYMLYIVYK